MGEPARKLEPATIADLEALPPNVKGEIIDGVLYTHARPRARHQALIGHLDRGLGGSFQEGGGRPGGWWILVEPGIEVMGSPEFSPDLAGWRVERMAELPEDTSIQVVPDWVCEVLSPSTRSYDLRTKRAFYARIGVKYLWYVDMDERSLTVSRLYEGKWLELGVYGEDDKVRAEPFEAVELEMEAWWISGKK